MMDLSIKVMTGATRVEARRAEKRSMERRVGK